MTMCGGPLTLGISVQTNAPWQQLRNYENGSQAEAYELKEGPDEDRQATSRQVGWSHG